MKQLLALSLSPSLPLDIFFKNRKLKKENNFLLNQKQEYAEQIEEVKKNHQLTIQKKTYQYKAKQDAYLEYFKKLDEYSERAVSETYDKVIDATKLFFDKYLNANNNQKLQNNAVVLYSSKMQQLIKESQKDYMHLQNSTNSVKAIASDKVFKSLEDLEESYKHLFESSIKIIKNLPKTILNKGGDKLNDIQKKFLEIESDLVKIKTELLKAQIRKELQES